MSHRDFDAARAERVRKIEPVTFTLGGETFTCVPEPVLGDALALADAPERGDNPTAALKAIISFVRSLLRPQDRRRFDRTLRRQRARRLGRRMPVSTPEVWEVGIWLAGQYTARPTRPPAEPSGGRPRSGGSSNSSTSPAAAETSPTPG